jgi:hypothetical protein
MFNGLIRWMKKNPIISIILIMMIIIPSIFIGSFIIYIVFLAIVIIYEFTIGKGNIP